MALNKRRATQQDIYVQTTSLYHTKAALWYILLGTLSANQHIIKAKPAGRAPFQNRLLLPDKIIYRPYLEDVSWEGLSVTQASWKSAKQLPSKGKCCHKYKKCHSRRCGSRWCSFLRAGNSWTTQQIELGFVKNESLGEYSRVFRFLIQPLDSQMLAEIDSFSIFGGLVLEKCW